MTIYAHPQARDSLTAGVERFRALLRVPTSSREVDTRYGRTHVLVAGPEDAPPLVVFHGAMASSAHVLSEMQPMLEKFRVYAPDILGHSPLSADARPPMTGYGPWAADVVAALGLDRTHVLGVSWGGFVAARLAATAPERVTRLSLLVPAGVVSGHLWESIVKLAIPMAMYRLFPSPERLRAFAAPQFTTVDDLWVPWLGEALRGFKMDFQAPPLAQPGDFTPVTAPVQVIAASDDIHFPGPALLERAAALFPTLEDTWLIPDCKHAPPFDDAFRARLSERLRGFFERAAV
jgi:2-hydroxy-6-oxonona-2,4-dienedioate hydrolase